MEKTIKSKIWVPDQDTFNQILKLQKFVTFVGNLEATPKEQKERVTEINAILKDFENGNSKKQFSISLDILHTNLNYREEDKENIDEHYYRSWFLCYEQKSLEIEVETKSSGLDSEKYEKEFFYSGTIYFERKLMPRRVYLDTPIEEFLKDAFSYKKYTSKIHNEIEIDLDIW